MTRAEDGPAVPHPAEDDELRSAVDRLAAEFADIHAREGVAACVADSRERLGSARIEMYLPLLAYRFARERLEASAVAGGLVPPDRPEVLFVCTANSARSQMAAALLAHRSGGAVSARSAGTRPAPAVDPGVLDVLAAEGVPAGGACPEPLAAEAVDVVVTMGCGDACPVLPGRRYVDWDLPDPAGQGPAAVRDVDDRLVVLVDELLAGLRP